jgi:hypothetical protein
MSFCCEECGEMFDDFEKGEQGTDGWVCRFCIAHNKNLEDSGLDDEGYE